jgi:general secretion pathway protein K
MIKFHPNSSNKGTVLFIVLLFIMAVTTVVLVSSMKMSAEFSLVQHEQERLDAYCRSVSGYHFAVNRLLTSLRTRAELMDINKRPYSPRLRLDGSPVHINLFNLIPPNFRDNLPVPPQRLKEMEVSVRLQDSAGLINFFKMDRILLKNYFAHHGIGNNRAEIIIDSLYDWMDPDDFSRPFGAEKAYYLDLSLPQPSNRLLDSNDEMLEVRGIDRGIYDHIGETLDFSVKNLGINPNTMPKETFWLFRGMTEDRIQVILQKRLEQEFESVEGLTLATGFNFSPFPRIFQFFTSNVTYVKIQAIIKNNMADNRYFFIISRFGKSGRGGVFSRDRDTGSRMKSTRGGVTGSPYEIFEWVEGTGIGKTDEREASQ